MPKKPQPSLPSVTDENVTVKTMFSSTDLGATEAEIERMRRKDRKILKKFPHKALAVTIHHRNKTTRTFIIRTNQLWFNYLKGTYVIDMEHARNDLTRGLPHLHYDEDVSVPVHHGAEKKGDKAWFCVTPETMMHYLKMEVVKAFVGSVEINKYLKMLVVITAFGSMASVTVLIIILTQMSKLFV